MAQLRRSHSDFVDRRTGIVLISFAPTKWVDHFNEDTGSPFPLLLDPSRETYQAYGLGSTFIRLLTPQVLVYYLRGFLSGSRIHLSPRGDPRQLGGDFLVDARGRLLYRNISRHPADRPRIIDLLAAIDEVRG